MDSISSLIKQSNPYEQSIQAIMQVERQQLRTLQTQQQTEQKRNTAIDDISSKLSKLNSNIEQFLNDPADLLSPYKATSSNPDAFSIVSTGQVDQPGSYDIDVSQVAKRDREQSGVFTGTGTDLNGTGSGSFDLTIGSDAPINISLDTTGKTNQEVLQGVADQINNASDRAQATVFQVNDGSYQLSIKSSETGRANALSISNVQGDMQQLGLTSAYADSELDAKFSVDGINFQRSSNVVDDVISGVSFEINGETASTQQMDISLDSEQVEKNIKSFIDAFNAANKKIRTSTFVSKSGNDGVLQDERSIRNMTYQLRQEAFEPISAMSGNSVSQLSDLGIEFEQDGTMKLEDASKLQDALSNNPGDVKEFFSGTGGLAEKLQSRIDLYIKGDEGLLDSIQNGIDSKLDRLDDSIESEQDYLERKEEQVRDQFAQLQQVQMQSQSQYNSLMQFQSKLGL